MHEAEITIIKAPTVSYLKVMGAKRSYKRSSVNITETKSELRIHVAADDPTALKASINSILNEIEIVENASRI